jgi:NAD(P)-dependent dehydrogenase (short-subunit alcohol dehydrogenase family)
MFTRDLLGGKRILVTGGGTGLGKSMSRRFLELGASVVICGRRQNVLEETAIEFAKEFPERIAWHVCDIRGASQVEAMVETVWAARPLDALVNNAAGNFVARTETLSPRAVDVILSVVLHGSAYVTLACGKRWLATGHPATVPVDRDDLRLDGFRLRRAVSHGESGGSRDDPLARRRMGRSWYSAQCHRTGPVPDARRLGAAGSEARSCP